MKLNKFLEIIPDDANLEVIVPSSNDRCVGKHYWGDKEFIKDIADCGKHEIKKIATKQLFIIDCKPYPFSEDDEEENSVTLVDVATKIYDQLNVYAEAKGLTAEELIISIIKEWLENVEVIDV